MSALIIDRIQQMEEPSSSISVLPIDLVERLMNQLPATPFAVKNRELRFIHVNKAMLKLAGVQSVEQMLGRRSRDFFQDESWRKFEEQDLLVLQTGKPISDQLVRTVRKDGTATWIMFGRWPVSGPAGEIVGVAAIARDLSASDQRRSSFGRAAPIIEHIQNHFAEPIEVAELAKRAGVSVSQLDRDFTALLGLTPTKYQKRIRLERAQEMLLNTGLSIAKIAHACGYADQSVFTRNFHGALGVSPRDFRRLHGRD